MTTAARGAPVTGADVEQALGRIRRHVRHTPLEHSPALSERLQTDVYLKMECWQVTGSFKPRISFSKLLALSAAERERGVIASTAGGHGIGLAYAARVLGVPARIFLPRTADPRKIATMRRYGADLTYFESVEEARVAARAEAERAGLTFVSAYNDPLIVAGGGTVGLEILQDLPEVATLVTGIGGGGLIAGCAIAIRTGRASLDVWGVQPEGSAVLARWLEAGHPVEMPVRPSIADGLGAAIETDSITFPLAQQHVRRTILVSEDEIRGAMAWALEEHQLVLEPSGAAPIAALLKEPAAAGPVAVILTGRNVSRRRFFDLLEGHAALPGKLNRDEGPNS
ncbi:MAG TPA: threonine/serine dehydratase [Gemmatimonadales bacterium]